jgi:hypothetical protein
VKVLWIAALLALAGCSAQQVKSMQPTALDFGDSVSKSYSARARSNLYGIVDFRHDGWNTTGLDPKAKGYSHEFILKARNNGYSTTLLARVETALEGQHYNIILYNSGIHDLQHDPMNVGTVRIPENSYRNNLEGIAEEVEQHADIVIWIDTPDMDGDFGVIGDDVVAESDVSRYNTIAESIAKDHGFYILKLPHARHNGTVHFTHSGYNDLGDAVANCVVTALNMTETESCHH